MKKDIFISYSSKDKAKVIPFVHKLEESVGEIIWLDLDGIESGSQFEETIVGAIDGCKVFVYMLSDSSMTSEWTRREVLYAESEGKYIVPVLLDNDKLKGWFKFHFGNIDYVLYNNKEHLERLVRTICTRLNITPLISYNKDALNHLCQYIDHDKIGFKSTFDNRVYITPKFDHADNFHDGISRVMNDGKYGYIDKTGKIIAPCIYPIAEPFNDGMAWVGRVVRERVSKTSIGDLILHDYEFGAMNPKGEIIIPFKEYNNGPGKFSEGMAAVYDENNKCGFIDKYGNLVIPCQYILGGGTKPYFDYGSTLVRRANKPEYLLLNKAGEIMVILTENVMARVYNNARGEGMIGFSQNNMLGFINILGKKIVVSPAYKTISAFHEGLASVGKTWDNQGYINKNGDVVISLIYQSAERFSEGVAWVKQNNKFGAIDKNGKAVIASRFDDAFVFENGICKVGIGEPKSRKYGIVRRDGNMIIPCLYDQINSNFWETIIWATKNGKCGAVDKDNNVVIPFAYERNWAVTRDAKLFYSRDGDKSFCIDIWGNTMKFIL